SRDVLPNFAFTPDSRAVVVAYEGKIHRIAIDGNDDRIIPFQANVSLELADRIRFPQRVSDAPVRGRIVQHLALDATGRVAFSTLARVYVTDPSGGVPRRLTRTEHPREFMPAWSPDGAWVAFVTWGAQGGHLWKARADGREAPVRLTTVASLWVDPAWSPAGDSIVVIRAPTSSSHAVTATGTTPASVGIPPDAELVIVPAAGGTPRVVTGGTAVRRPHFGGDARRVYAASGTGALVSISLDDGKRNVVATAARSRGGIGASAAAMRVSPDGQQVALVIDERLYRMPMPPAGGAAPPVLDPRGTGASATELGALAPAAVAWSTDGSSIAWVNGSRVTRVRADAPGATPATVALPVEVPRAKPTGSVVLRGGRVITMRGNEIIPNADIVVTGNRIASIGARGGAPIPAGART
ncbi:MAG TPA: LpqB family beta-propeller domain-containing protein, partial [Gemmatimonadaceae bacterium]|nr:LpqB family beta-propeller domain-containing protein [Gemmatimonadaceae bacterium]